MTETANLDLPLIAAEQAQKHVTHNEALVLLDAVVQLSVIDRGLTAPPGGEAEGDRYIVAAAATGAWAGQSGKIAIFHDGGWLFLSARPGWIAWVVDEATLVFWAGSAWTVFSDAVTALQNLTLLGVGTTADGTNPFSAKLNKALWTALTTGEGGDGDLRYTLNKEGTADVLSFLMQTGFSGRAELGLIGDDDLTLKVSPDGSAWHDAVRIDRASGTAAFPQTGSLAHVVRGTFEKADAASAAFTKTGAGTMEIKAGTIVELAGLLHVFSSNASVVMPTLAAGTDYAIYICNDGTVRADVNFSAPSGYSTSTSRRIGGFHYAPGGNAATTAGGNTTPAINEYSIWDLKWRPACEDPRGMTLIAGGFWCDIYLLGVNHHADGTSRNDVTIADGSSPPKIPAAFGGDGSTAYSTLNWWEAAEVMQSHGKQLLSYAEFAAAAYGATEAQARGNDPVTTGLSTTNSGSSNADEEQTSKWGLIQATGCMWVWGRDFGGDHLAASYTANTGGRGSTHTLSNAALFGGAWNSGANAGSRASFWNGAPTFSNGSVGALGRSDHMCHG